jgi:GntR family transcriptional regulator/MocR family aminotransferase
MDILTFTIQQEDTIPIYQQLYSFIKNELQTGQIPSGTRLPSKRKLSSHLGISLNTVQTAYNQLIEEGYIIPEERKGFYAGRVDHLQQLKLSQPEEVMTREDTSEKPIIDFSYHGVDQPSFPFSIWRKLMKEVINEYDEELLKTGDSLGYYRLRSAIAGYLHQSRGVNCRDSQIIISSGTETLYQIVIQLLGKDCVFGIENPGYEKLNQLFGNSYADFKAISIDRFGMIPEEIHKSNANVLCITPSHQFPTGEIMPVSRRLELLHWSNERQGRYLIEDDYDSEFKYGTKPIPALQGLDMNDKVIYIGSFSKSLSSTIRVSYMVLPSELMKSYTARFSYILCPVPIFEQKVLYRFIDEGYFERHLNRMRNIYKKKREALVKALTEMNHDIEILGAEAGLHLLIRVPNRMTEEQLIRSALGLGVRVYGISGYYTGKKPADASPALMLGYAMMTEADIHAAVKLLQQAWFSTEIPAVLP